MVRKPYDKKKFLNKTVQPSWLLFFLTLGLTLFGLLMVYNTSVVEAERVFHDRYYYLKNQLLWAGIGIFLMGFFSKINYQWLRKVINPIFFLNLLLLIVILIPGISKPIKGARRWLDFGSFVIQPAEFIKLTFIIYLSSWLQKRRSLKYFLFLLLFISLLIILEPDMGTLVVIAIIALAIYFLSGASIWKLLLTFFVFFFLGFVLILTSSYRRNRFLSFLNFQSDPLGASYHQRQALIALGSGGLWGLGLGHSRQKYEFLPEATTDSIFAVIAEEFGFLGGVIFVSMLLLLILKSLQISFYTPDKFGQLIAGGIAVWIGCQSVINIFAMVKLLPLTGLPLPFVSYGGSSLITLLSAIGILLSISKKVEK